MIHGNICTDVARRFKDGEVVKLLEAERRQGYPKPSQASEAAGTRTQDQRIKSPDEPEE
jgi:hypothetical protein